MIRSVVQLEHIGVNAIGDCIAGRQVVLQFRSCRGEVRQFVNAGVGIEEIEIATVIGKRHRVGRRACMAIRAAPRRLRINSWMVCVSNWTKPPSKKEDKVPIDLHPRVCASCE